MNVICIIQTRIGSTRLPGKVLRDLQGKPMIQQVIDRVCDAKTINSIVIGITALPEDNAIINVVDGYRERIFIFRENFDRPRDLLDLYYQAGKHFNADIVVRVTSDCPLIDPEIIDQVVQPLLDDPTLEYCSNVLGKLTFPRGLDVQAVRLTALEKIWHIAKEPEDREHVTLYIRKHPEEFRALAITSDSNLSFFRWTVDELDDYKLISEIYSRLYPMNPKFRMKDCLGLFVKDPELIKINQHVQQKLAQY
ncbi:MAG: glycosyltransferase family protein [Patescibacteria group bacterium]